MNRAIVVLAAGILCGGAAHVAWFRLNRPCGGDQLGCQLAWMRSELRLTDEQYARIRAIHEKTSPRLLALAAQVAQMRNEYAAFERTRRTSGEVDFLEFARFIEQRRAVDRECLATTRQLVAATSRTMSPAQRERYLGLLGPVFNDRGTAISQ